MRNFAKCLISHESLGNKSSEEKTQVNFQIFKKLSPHLATLMGTGGFRALLSRALVLAGAEVRWLRALHVKSDGSLDGMEELRVQLDPDEFLEGRIVLLAQLLGLLSAFVGENLTLRLIGEIWPKAPLGDLSFANGEKNEKEK
jgi:hypothetical protein